MCKWHEKSGREEMDCQLGKVKCVLCRKDQKYLAVIVSVYVWVCIEVRGMYIHYLCAVPSVSTSVSAKRVPEQED